MAAWLTMNILIDTMTLPDNISAIWTEYFGTSPKIPIALFVIAVGLIVWSVYERSSEAPAAVDTPAPQSTVSNVNVTSHNQTGGITAGSVHFAPPSRNLANMHHLREQLLGDLDKARSLSILAIAGDNEAYDFALQVSQFLFQNGYKVTNNGQIPTSVGTFMNGGRPDPLSIRDLNGHLHLYVGPRANN